VAAGGCRASRLRLANNLFTNDYYPFAQTMTGFLQVLPVLIGVFVSGSVLARELETGTFRFAWTQGCGRMRWVIAKLALLAVVVTVAVEAFSLLFSWYFQPWLLGNPGNRSAWRAAGATRASWHVQPHLRICPHQPTPSR
jgi:hypothetical protein